MIISFVPFKMADVAKAPAADSGAKPSKPDEAKFKSDVEQAEKEHKAAQAKFVRNIIGSPCTLFANKIM